MMSAPNTNDPNMSNMSDVPMWSDAFASDGAAPLLDQQQSYSSFGFPSSPPRQNAHMDPTSGSAPFGPSGGQPFSQYPNAMPMDSNIALPMNSSIALPMDSNMDFMYPIHNASAPVFPTQHLQGHQNATRPILTFQQIHNIPDTIHSQQHGQQPTTKQNPGRDETYLLRKMLIRPNSVEDEDVLYKLVQSGEIADPLPHYLHIEKKDLISWIQGLLRSKLNTLLNAETDRRPRMRLLKNTKVGKGGDQDELVRWCNTGQRKNIDFRAYEDWVDILQNFDFTKELRIHDMMVLITEAYSRVYPNDADGMQLLAALAPPLPASQDLQAFDFEGAQSDYQPFEQQPSAEYDNLYQTQMQGFGDGMLPPSVASVGPAAQLDTNNYPPETLYLLLDGGFDDEEEAYMQSTSPEEQPSQVRSSHKIGDIINHNSTSSELYDVPAYIDELRKDFSHVPEEFDDEELMYGPLPPDPTSPELNQRLRDQVAPMQQDLPLFRSLNTPHAGDYSKLARCVRFAQLASQEHVEWRIHHLHVAEIEKCANWYGMELLYGRTDVDLRAIGLGGSLAEFEAVLAIGIAHEDFDTESTAASIDSIIKSVHDNFNAGYILGLLTDEDKVRFANHLRPYEEKHAEWLAAQVEDGEDE
jgi:hypothetical protein